MALSLQPLPLPGLALFPNFTAQRQETFLMKAQDHLLGKAAQLISYCTPNGDAGAPFLQLKEETSNNVFFRTMDGKEMMRILVHRHSAFSHKTEYKGIRSEDGKEIWELELKTGWRVPSYSTSLPILFANPDSSSPYIAS